MNSTVAHTHDPNTGGPWFKANLGYIVEGRKMEDRWRGIEGLKEEKKEKEERGKARRTEEIGKSLK